jgi:hypothetical protein
MTSRPRSNENTVQHAIRLAKARIALPRRCRSRVAQQGAQLCIGWLLGFDDNFGDGEVSRVLDVAYAGAALRPTQKAANV